MCFSPLSHFFLGGVSFILGYGWIFLLAVRKNQLCDVTSWHKNPSEPIPPPSSSSSSYPKSVSSRRYFKSPPGDGKYSGNASARVPSHLGTTFWVVLDWKGEIPRRATKYTNTTPHAWNRMRHTLRRLKKIHRLIRQNVIKKWKVQMDKNYCI